MPRDIRRTTPAGRDRAYRSSAHRAMLRPSKPRLASSPERILREFEISYRLSFQWPLKDNCSTTRDESRSSYNFWHTSLHIGMVTKPFVGKVLVLSSTRYPRLMLNVGRIELSRTIYFGGNNRVLRCGITTRYRYH